MDRIVIGEEDERRTASRRQLGRELERRSERHAPSQGPLGRPLVDRAVRDRIGERHPDLTTSAPARPRAPTIARVAARSGSPALTYGTSATRPSFRARAKGRPDPAGGRTRRAHSPSIRIPSRSATCRTSFVATAGQVHDDEPAEGASTPLAQDVGDGVRRFQGGNDPFILREQVEAPSASSSEIWAYSSALIAEVRTCSGPTAA